MQRTGIVSVERRDFTLRRLLATADVLAIAVSISLATSLFGYAGSSLGRTAWGLLTLPAWILLFKTYGLYDRDAKRVSHSTVEELPWLFHAIIVGGLGLWLFYKVMPPEKLSLREGIAFCAAVLPGLLATRAVARAVAHRIVEPERVLFLGGGPMAKLLIQKIRLHPEYRLRPIGYVDAVDTPADGLEGELPYLGHLSDLESICESAGVNRVVVLAPAVDHAALADLIRLTKGLEVRISILPHVVDVLGSSVEIDDVEGITVLGINPPALTRSSRFLKRAMDVSIALAALVALLPALIIIAVAIKLDSPGPVIYRQDRIGHRGRRFRISKFRTMVQDAEARVGDLKSLSAHPAWLLLDHDPRVTRVGRFLRHTSLDELPQLWNVVRGDMSLVGPRPMTPDVDEQISGWGRRRLDLTPGITGLWQVLGRTNIPFEEMVKLDYLYVTNWSLWQDIRLLISTLPAVFRQRGAN
ncbi:MAG: sugar transferase [Chloroflexi bacterium]|nr:sugar transferase [Chloroflexota bacterium]